MRWVYMVTLSKVLFLKWYCNRFSFALSHTFSIVSLILSLKWTEISLNWLRLSIPYWRSWSNSEVKQIIPYYSIVSLSQFFFFLFLFIPSTKHHHCIRHWCVNVFNICTILIVLTTLYFLHFPQSFFFRFLLLHEYSLLRPSFNAFSPKQQTKWKRQNKNFASEFIRCHTSRRKIWLMKQNVM